MGLKGLCSIGRDALEWINLSGTVAVINHDYDVSYRVNNLTRTLHLRGSVTINTADNAGKDPTTFYDFFTLPVTIAFKCPFIAIQRNHSMALANQIDFLSAEVDTTGVVRLGVKKAPSGITSYTVVFNEIFPLD